MALEIGLAVGGAFLSSALNVIFDHLAPQGQWLEVFQNKQSSNRSVREWVNELQDAVEDAENLLDEINYEALKCKVEAQHQTSGETSPLQQVMISDEFLGEIMPKVKETFDTLKGLEEQIGYLALLKDTGLGKQEAPQRPLMTSVVEDSEVYGRKDEIEHLVNRLLFPVDGENPRVIPIVGLGGLAKTTLARMVYNDQSDVAIWELSSTGGFTVSSAWDYIRHKSSHTEACKHMRIKGLPLKMSFFLWRLWHGRIPTDDVISRRLGFQLPSKCSCLIPQQETVTHVFFLLQRWLRKCGFSSLALQASPLLLRLSHKLL